MYWNAKSHPFPQFMDTLMWKRWFLKEVESKHDNASMDFLQHVVPMLRNRLLVWAKWQHMPWIFKFQFYHQNILGFGERKLLLSFQSKLHSLGHPKWGFLGVRVLLRKGNFQTFQIQSSICNRAQSARLNLFSFHRPGLEENERFMKTISIRSIT